MGSFRIFVRNNTSIISSSNREKFWTMKLLSLFSRMTPKSVNSPY